MLKIDSHQHFWDLNRLTYPWLTPDLQPLYHTFTPDDLQPNLTAYNIQGTVVVQATHDLAETDWLLTLAQNTPAIQGVVGWLDLTAPDLEATLDSFLSQGPLCGVRHQVHDEPDPEWLLREPVIRGLQLLAQRGIPFDLLVRPIHLKVLPRLFEAVPDGRWIIDHIAKPEIKRGVIEPWATDLAAAARYPNVYCKISGIITEADPHHLTINTIRPYFERALAIFGPERLMFGSDWPVCLLAGSYGAVHDLVAALIHALTPPEKAAIWGLNARAVYRLRQHDDATHQ